jgi:hypothetical protein
MVRIDTNYAPPHLVFTWNKWGDFNSQSTPTVAYDRIALSEVLSVKSFS